MTSRKDYRERAAVRVENAETPDGFHPPASESGRARRLARIFLAALVLFVTAGTVLYIVPLFFPLPADIAAEAPSGLLYVDREGRPLRRALDGEWRAEEPARYEDFPEVLLQATLAAEDARFFSHRGIDYLGTARAARDGVTRRRAVSGASTISQQTIKLYSPPRARTLRTKAIEIFSARKLEIFTDKETILTAYLNRLPYGNQYTGARAAASGYFGKPLGDLSLAEAALLAGLPNKPTRLNPWSNREGARQRQVWILGRMKKLGWISEVQFAAALIEPLQFLPGPATVFHAPHFVDFVNLKEPEAAAAAKEQRRPVRTTLDLSLQEFVEHTVAAELARLGHESKDRDEVHAAAVVIENATGDVLALTGSRSFFSHGAGQVNGAWSPRSAGSALKPFTYVRAIERGYTAASVLADTPIEYITSNGTYQPVNFHRQFQGPVSLRKALASSLNVPSVKLLDAIGGPGVLHELLAEELRLTSLDRPASDYGLGLTLGNAEVRLIELANAYACLARLGEFQPFRLLREEGRAAGTPPPAPPPPTDRERLTDQQGRVGGARGSGLEFGPTPGQSLLDPAASWLIADILSDENARAEAFGRNSPLNLPFRAAVKTGTSTDFRDNWTLGYTPDFTVGVWVGRFNNRPLNQVSGAMGAAPIYQQIMLRLHREREPRWYDRPVGSVQVEVDVLNGKQPIPDLGLKAPRTRPEWFVNGILPPPAAAADYEEDGRTILPHSYRTWWSGESNPLKAVAALAPLSEKDETVPFRIVSPLNGTKAFLDPDLPRSGARFPLEIAGRGDEDIEWESPTLKVEREGEWHWVVLEPGEHRITARDQRNGREATATLTVQAL
jgi:penicillin-binding protein 1C